MHCWDGSNDALWATLCENVTMNLELQTLNGICNKTSGGHSRMEKLMVLTINERYMFSSVRGIIDYATSRRI
jgi:hypothetical protein